MLAVVVLGVVASVTAAQAAVVQNDSQTVPFFAFVPCANGGAGELVSGTIELHTVVTSTVNGNNISGKVHFQPQGSDLVGAVTGDRYQGTGVTQDQFKASLQNGQFEETFVNNFHIIGPGPGNNVLVHENSHITVNANGDVPVVHSNFSTECR